MPSVLFLMKYPLHRRENLQAKFDGQMQAFSTLGYTVYYIGWDEQGMSLVGDGNTQRLLTCSFTRMPGYDHTKIFFDLMKAAQAASARQPFDIVYMRYMPTFPGSVRAIRALKQAGCRLIVEYPTYPPSTENNRFFVRRQVFRLTDRIMRKIHPMVDLYTLIGKAVNDTLDGRPAMNILNGVNAEMLARHKPRSNAADVRLLALASMSGWHGFDRILDALAHYQGETDVHIHFVGGDGDGSLAAWIALAQERGIESKVTFHGPLYGDALEAVIAGCDAGVGSLGMFRFGLSQGMTLKAREYMARGLPFISAVSDPAIPNNKQYLLQVPNDETPIDMAEVVSFVQAARGNPDAAEAMRRYAMETLSWKGIIAKVLERLQL